MRTELILIRHGQTSWNKQKRYLGWTDIGLDDTGREQAKRTMSRLSSVKTDKVYSSDLSRAMDFAKAVFGSKPEPVAGLREINFGSFEGLRYEDIVKRWPDAYDTWIRDPFKCSIPGGERLADVSDRVMSAINQIIAQCQGKTVAAVSHAGPIAIAMREFSGGGDFWTSWPEPACVNIIIFENGRPRIVTRNDYSHLGEMNG